MYYLEIFILTDKNGDWWEGLKTDNSTDIFYHASSKMKKWKDFTCPKKAQKHAEKHLKDRRFRVVEQINAVRKIVYDSFK